MSSYFLFHLCVVCSRYLITNTGNKNSLKIASKATHEHIKLVCVK